MRQFSPLAVALMLASMAWGMALVHAAELSADTLAPVVTIDPGTDTSGRLGAGIVVGVGPDAAAGKIEVTVLTAEHVVTMPDSARVALRAKPYLFYPVIRAIKVAALNDVLAVLIAVPRAELDRANLRSVRLGVPADNTILRPVGNPFGGPMYFSDLEVRVDSPASDGPEFSLVSVTTSCPPDFDPAKPCVVEGFSGGPLFSIDGSWVGMVQEIGAGTWADRLIASLQAQSINTNLIANYDNQLVEASILGAPERAAVLCRAGASARGTSSGVPLLLAAERGYLDVVRELSKCRDFDVNARGASEMTALIAASSYGSKALVEALLGMGADPLLVDDSGATGLHAAASGTGNTELRPGIIADLVAAGLGVDSLSTLGWSPLATAVVSERDGPARTEIARALLKAGADPNVTIDWIGDQRSLISIAATDGLSSTLDLLLSSGATVDPISSTGRTPLMDVAAEHPDNFLQREGDARYCWNGEDGLSIRAGVLLRHGANRSLKDTNGQSAIQLAEARDVFTPGDKRCRDCMVLTLRGESCRDSWDK
ncbi:ankyrin repeat domain-containing protein [Mesorhizobium sp. M0659]|uniref:ankyrin repeat domain-containing protein n=1 Tax=Mesorhizobium sp. M0659 TaxID=2956980 RepID=UPI00333C456B